MVYTDDWHEPGQLTLENKVDGLQKQIDDISKKLDSTIKYLGLDLESPLSFSPKEKGITYKEYIESIKKEANETDKV